MASDRIAKKEAPYLFWQLLGVRVDIVNKLCLFLLIATCCLLASCTKTKLAYGFLDNWLRWQTENYFDPSAEQKDLLKRLTKQFQTWHRHNELEELANLIGRSAQTLSQPTLVESDIKTMVENIKTMYQRNATQLSVIAEQILPTLSTEQITQIIAQINKEITTYQEESVAISNQEMIDKRNESMSDFLADKVGKLTPQQQQLIERWAAQQANLAALNLMQQLLWRNKFTDLLHADLTDTATRKAACDLIFNEADFVNADHERLIMADRKKTAQMIAELHRTLTEKQRNNLQTRLKRYEQDFRELSQS